MRLRILLLTLLIGCGINPQPSPPSLDVNSVMTASRSASLRSPGTLIVAPPGSVSPPEGIVVVTRLDGIDPPHAEPIAHDGSFRIVSSALNTEELRVQVRQSASVRSEPFDLQVLDGGLVPAPRPLADCFVASPPLELASDAIEGAVMVEVRLQNDCDDAIELQAELRVRHPAFSIDRAPERIESGAASVVELTLLAPVAAIAEDVLIVNIDSPARDRRAISLFAQRR